MATYSIPDDFLPGFIGIINMSDNDFNTLQSLIGNLRIAEPLGDFLNNSIDKFAGVSPNELQAIVQSLVSIGGIFENANYNIDEFTSDFSRSFLISQSDVKSEEGEVLKSRLSILLSNFNNLSITIKGEDLLTDNQKNFRDARIISDVRLLFNNDLSSNNNAVIVHNLKIHYYENRNLKDFFVALDLYDLRKMKSIIDRAIEKHKIINDTYTNLSFLDFNNAGTNPSN